MIKKIKTSRLILKNFGLQDLDDLVEIFSDKETMNFYGIEPFKSQDEIENMILNKNRKIDRGIGVRWGIFFNKKLIGTCGYLHYMPHDRGVISIEINKKYWGFGYASEAINGIVEYGFYKLKIHRIEGLISPENHASRKIAEKCGFQLEGILRESVYRFNEYQDQCLYSKIKGL